MELTREQVSAVLRIVGDSESVNPEPLEAILGHGHAFLVPGYAYRMDGASKPDADETLGFRSGVGSHGLLRLLAEHLGVKYEPAVDRVTEARRITAALTEWCGVVDGQT